MPNIDKHPAGAFCWIELATSDQEAAKAFYNKVFGWSYEDSPMGPGEFYTMFQLAGRPVGAAYTQHGPEKEMGVPPHWNLYIEVDSADASAAKASELGGQVLAGPFDVETYGRMAVVRDPQGAVFCIWQRKDHDGFAVRDEHGTFCWADLNTPDRDAAAAFYEALFGWKVLPAQDGYQMLQNGESPIGGMPSAQQLPPNVPPHWMIYLQVDDCDAIAARTKEAGGTVCMGPMTMENVGRLAVLQDPQGAAFAIFKPAPRA